MGNLSDFAIGAIVVGAIVIAALFVPGGPSSKEVAAETHKRLVGKVAEDRATARHRSMAAGQAAIPKLILAALIAGGIGYLVVSNMPLEGEVGPTPTIAPLQPAP